MNAVLRSLAPPLLLLTACAGPSPDSSPPAEPSLAFPAFDAPAGDETVYRVDRAASLLLVRVDPAGPMARLGHSHVIGGPVISGTIVEGPESARLALAVDVAELVVDRPEWRRSHGLDEDLDPTAVDGTRANLLGPAVLDAASHPTIAIRSTSVRGPDWLPEVVARIAFQDRVHEIALPVAVQRDGARLRAFGTIDVDHAELGLEPFSAAGGALRVADPIRIRFRIEAVAETDDVAIIAGHPNDRDRAP